MSTVVKQLGPEDHGQPMSYEEFLSGDYRKGYHYELIDGRLYVYPEPNLPENRVEMWLLFTLHHYALENPRTINYVTNKARVFVPNRQDTTAPEPDIVAYHNFPAHLSRNDVNWQEIGPILVIEVLTSEDPHKDTVRNVALYRQVPSIKEYWIFDARADADHPTVHVRRKYRGRWQTPIEVQPGETYTTGLLPGFELLVDPPS
jgi:Uma2 family endonuclease